MKKQIDDQSEIWTIAAGGIHDNEYRTTYSQALDSIIRDKNLEILDTAGGTGFPTMDLYNLGYKNISVTDGDEVLAGELQKQFEAKGISIKAIPTLWQELGQKVSKKFDIVLNADNAFVYMDGWTGGKTVEGKDAVLARLKIGLENFYEVTKSGGLTIVGLGKHYVPTFTHSDRNFKFTKDGEDYDIKWEGIYNWDRRINEWTTTVESENHSGSFLRKAYLVTKEELADLMKKVGFKDVHVFEPENTRDNLIIGTK
jgi:hypothetical protein